MNQRRGVTWGSCVAVAFLTLAALARADVPSQECGTVVKPEMVHQLDRLDAMLRMAQPDVLPARRCIPLTIHIVRTSAGIGGISVAQVNQGINDCNNAYAVMNMSFYNAGAIDYIDDDNYYDHELSDAQIDLLKSTHTVAHTINCYFVPQLGFCGISNFPGDPTQGIVLLNDCVGVPSNPSTFPHEIGHYFALYHTHETMFGAELVTRDSTANCPIAGDKLCDTPADPNLSGLTGAGCVYTGTARDLNGDLYTPDTHQYMSYAEKTCRTVFSPRSQFKILEALSSSRADLLGTPSINASAGPGGTIVPSGVVSVGCGANQIFTIAAVPGAVIADVLVDDASVGAVSVYTFQGVKANHTIVATFMSPVGDGGGEGGGGYWTPGCRRCLPMIDAAIVWPNPGDRVTVTFTLREAASVSVKVYDIAGREVTRIPERAMAAGRNSVTWDGRQTDGSAAKSGLYFIRLRAGSEEVRRTVIRMHAAQP